ncbi:hypothetical protein JL722_2172 [Aureococcus anophagefferens]|nr:hypothetical protein JL722_2172 [Aureococcus anophagefferens]
MVRLALLLVAAAVHDEPERYPLGATKAWENTESGYFKKIDNAARLAKKNMPDDLAWQLHDKTECYSGAEGLYSKRTVFCDAECLHSGKPAEYCAGPWYCSTTRVCETYNHRHQGTIVHNQWRKCARIKSCAHYEQCFPTEEQFQAMGFHEGTNAEFQEVATTCCKNKNNYRSDIDIPCNAEDDFVDLTVDAPSDAPAARALGPLAVALSLAAAVMIRPSASAVDKAEIIKNKKERKRKEKLEKEREKERAAERAKNKALNPPPLLPSHHPLARRRSPSDAGEPGAPPPPNRAARRAAMEAANRQAQEAAQQQQLGLASNGSQNSLGGGLGDIGGLRGGPPGARPPAPPGGALGSHESVFEFNQQPRGRGDGYGQYGAQPAYGQQQGASLESLLGGAHRGGDANYGGAPLESLSGLWQQSQRQPQRGNPTGTGFDVPAPTATAAASTAPPTASRRRRALRPLSRAYGYQERSGYGANDLAAMAASALGPGAYGADALAADTAALNLLSGPVSNYQQPRHY